MRKRDLTGATFGELRVSRFVGNDGHGHGLWECACSCGRAYVARGDYLQAGKITHCRACPAPKVTIETYTYPVTIRNGRASRPGDAGFGVVRSGTRILLVTDWMEMPIVRNNQPVAIETVFRAAAKGLVKSTGETDMSRADAARWVKRNVARLTMVNRTNREDVVAIFGKYR